MLSVMLFNMVTNMNFNVELHIILLVCERAKYMQKRKMYSKITPAHTSHNIKTNNK